MSLLQDAREKARRLLVFSDPTDILAVDYVYSLFAAQFLTGLKERIVEPAWGHLLGTPGSGKTELVNPFLKWSRTYQTDVLTAKSLVSGYTDERGNSCSILDDLNGKVLCIPDWTSQASQDPKQAAELFGLLRRAFDGSLVKVFGNEAGRQGGACDFGFVNCSVPSSIDNFSEQSQTLGERFLVLRIRRTRMPPLQLLQLNNRINRQSPGKSRKRREWADWTHTAMSEFVSTWSASTGSDFNSFFNPDDPMSKALASASVLTSLFRTAPSDTGPVDASDNIRVGNQLAKLTIARAVLDGRDHYDDSDLHFMARVAHDTVPPWINRLVGFLAADSQTFSELSDRLPGTFRALAPRLQQLVHVGIVEAQADRYALTDDGKSLLSSLPYFESRPGSPSGSREVTL